jgi:hypothetical protein
MSCGEIVYCVVKYLVFAWKLFANLTPRDSTGANTTVSHCGQYWSKHYSLTLWTVLEQTSWLMLDLKFFSGIMQVEMRA